MVAREEALHQHAQRMRAREGLGRLAAVAQIGEPGLLVLQRFEKIGPRLGELLGREPGTRRAAVALGEEDLEIGGEACGARRRGERGCFGRRAIELDGAQEGRAKVAVARLRAAGEPGGEIAPMPGREAAIDHLAFDRGEALLRAKAERPPQPLGGLRWVALGEDRAVAQSIPDERLEFRLRDVFGEARIGAAEIARVVLRLAQDVAAGAVEKLGLRDIVEHFETSRHIGLEREEMQQSLAEGVDRLDLEAARRFDRVSEEASREGQFGRRTRRRADFRDGLGERRVVELGPARQCREDAGRHIGGRRLGEGEAEDLRRRHAGKQVAQNPLGEHMRLARAGIGGNPDRDIGIRGAALPRADMCRNLAPRAHAAPPGSTPLDHSLTRAR